MRANYLGALKSLWSYILVPSTHVTFVGVSAGKYNATNIELGSGTQGILNVGYSRKF